MKIKEHGVTLIELLCLIVLTAVTVLMIVRGLNSVRMLQYRSDVLTRLNQASVNVMEEWKQKSISELPEGIVVVEQEGLRDLDRIEVSTVRLEDKGIMEITVHALHMDRRMPEDLVFRSYRCVDNKSGSGILHDGN